jgi:dinuclear metal center YbgI/SA1388 family protein
MENLNKIKAFLNDYLKIDQVEDVSWNGLQVEGSSKVSRVAFCVTGGGEVFKEILKWNPDLIIAHHGIFWKKANPSISGWMKKRITPLIKTDSSFYAVHLPLDKHSEVGNNVQILNLLNAEIIGEMADSIGWVGKIEETNVKLLKDKLESDLGTKTKLLDYGPKKISKIGVVSGAGGKYIYEALEKELDLLITGEEKDLAEVARDGEINIIFGGHYGTETLGIKALKEKIEEFYTTNTITVVN